MILAGVDIGNSTTEVCIGELISGNLQILSSGLVPTTGMKGTEENIQGIKAALEQALSKIGKKISDLDLLKINEAVPVLSDVALETLTQTIITDSTMLGHNPNTPAGEGYALGMTVSITDFMSISNTKSDPVVLVVSKTASYETAAEVINRHPNIVAAIVERDEAVLIANRLNRSIPIVDEVKLIDQVPLNKSAVVEVAPAGQVIKKLSNPYGLAALFQLDHEETKSAIPIAKSLIGNRSAVVIKTEKGAVQDVALPVGSLKFETKYGLKTLSLHEGAEVLMSALEEMPEDAFLYAEEGNTSSTLQKAFGSSRIEDILAVDMMVPVSVVGALSGEVLYENALALASMFKASPLSMNKLADSISKELAVPVRVGGLEGVMATLGALTTRGSALPIAVLDLGGGSTDAAVCSKDGLIKVVHLAGAGNLVTHVIQAQLSITEFSVAEWIKRHPLAKVESLFSLRLEDGLVQFFDEPLKASLLGRTVIRKGDELIPIECKRSLEQIIQIRRSAKAQVFIVNTKRALKKLGLRDYSSVVLVGGSSLDFEIADMIVEELSRLKIVAGRAEIRDLGPRNAVATGLVLSEMVSKEQRRIW